MLSSQTSLIISSLLYHRHHQAKPRGITQHLLVRILDSEHGTQRLESGVNLGRNRTTLVTRVLICKQDKWKMGINRTPCLGILSPKLPLSIPSPEKRWLTGDKFFNTHWQLSLKVQETTRLKQLIRSMYVIIRVICQKWMNAVLLHHYIENKGILAFYKNKKTLQCDWKCLSLFYYISPCHQPRLCYGATKCWSVWSPQTLRGCLSACMPPRYYVE